jgi:hypothetical protein
MKVRIKLLSFTVWMTVSLLSLGAVLVLLGIFNAQLGWDIFSPQVEAVMYGIFFSCLVLSGFGIAITFVVGIKQIVEAVESLRQSPTTIQIAPRGVSRLTYAGYMMGLFVTIAALIGILELVDYRIQDHRNQVFKRIAAEQMRRFELKLAQPLQKLASPALNPVPAVLPELLRALNSLSFIQGTTVYMVDPKDASVLWRYNLNQTDAKGKAVFNRFLIAKESEEAIRQALKGQPERLDAINAEANFRLYYSILGINKQAIAIVQIDGNPQENFRDYGQEAPTLEVD